MEIKRLADGQIPVSKTVVYTVPTGKKALVKLTVCNVSGATHPFIVYYTPSGGTSRSLYRRSIQSDWTSKFRDPMPMESGDAIELQSSDGATVFDYVITGTEESEIEVA